MIGDRYVIELVDGDDIEVTVSDDRDVALHGDDCIRIYLPGSITSIPWHRIHMVTYHKEGDRT